tara:strand:- start:339 stop:1493 length:1155 start_codon:yes stop_codon:yes gene_type:complete
MIRLICIFLFYFVLSNSVNGNIKEPGKANYLSCSIGALEAYNKGLQFIKKNPKKNFVVYLACNPPSYTWYWHKGSNLEKIHKKSYKECAKLSKKKGNGECYLFSLNEKIVWELSEEKMENLIKINLKKKMVLPNLDAKPIFSDEKMSEFEKNIIKKTDPSSFLKLKFVGRKNLKMEESDPDNFTLYENVYIYKALYKNNHEITLRLHPKFNKKKVENIAYDLSYAIGQLPYFLTKSYNKANIFKNKIYSKNDKGKKMSAAAMAGPNGTLIIDLTSEVSNLKKPYFQETLLHEAGHFVFRAISYSDDFKFTRNQDLKYISKYATTNIDEDLAETVVAWVGLRCKPERIKKSDFEKVSEGIKNRLKFIDNFAAKKLVNTYPMECNF